MLNGEKYRNQILEILNTHNDFAITKADKRIRACAGTNCSECLLNVKGMSCTGAMIKWLLSDECKESIKLSRLEYEILKYILNHTEYKYIARDRLGAIFIYENKPERHVDTWRVLINGGRYTNLTNLDKLFKFIKWLDLEPTSIQEVLNNCEVVDDAEE